MLRAYNPLPVCLDADLLGPNSPRVPEYRPCCSNFGKRAASLPCLATPSHSFPHYPQSPGLRQGGIQSVPRLDELEWSPRLSLFLSVGCKQSFTASCRQGSYSTLSTRRPKTSPTQNRPWRRSGRSTTCPRKLRWKLWCPRLVVGSRDRKEVRKLVDGVDRKGTGEG